MTDTSTSSDLTPAPSTRRRHGSGRRRRLAFLLAAVILLIAGVVAGVVVTRPAPKRHKVVAVVHKPKPKPEPVNHDLTPAAFASRWNRLVAGPSDVALTPVAFEGSNGGQQLVPLSVVVASPTHWIWDIPAINIGGSSSAAMAFSATPTGGVEHVGPLTNSGLTIFSPVTGIYGPGALAVLNDSLPAPDATELIRGEPIPALADPQIVSATKSAWTVRFDVLWPTCYAPAGTPRICGAGLPSAEFPPATLSPSGIGGGAGAGSDIASATVAVAPTATGGLQIALAPGTLNAEPTGAP